MRIKTLFSIPDGEKVTEKALCKVLISSICSILLCMACLVSTTWAWFAVSIENTGNVIEIATVTANVTITNDKNEIIKSDNGNYSLNEGTYITRIKLESNATDTNELGDQKKPVYVLMSVAHNDETQYYYFTFEGSQKEVTKEISIGGGSAIVGFSVSWVKPVSATPIGDVAAKIGEIPTEPTTDPSTGITTDPPTEPITDPATDPSVEETTEPPVQPEANPTERAPTEAPADAATDSSTVPAAEPEDEPNGTPTDSSSSETSVQETEMAEPTAATSAEGAADAAEDVNETEAVS